MKSVPSAVCSEDPEPFWNSPSFLLHSPPLSPQCLPFPLKPEQLLALGPMGVTQGRVSGKSLRAGALLSHSQASRPASLDFSLEHLLDAFVSWSTESLKDPR